MRSSTHSHIIYCDVVDTEVIGGGSVKMGLPEVGADVIDTEVTGATVTMGAPVKGMDEVDGNIRASVVDVIGAGSGASSIGAGLGSGVS